jgi:arginase family enzyme
LDAARRAPELVRRAGWRGGCARGAASRGPPDREALPAVSYPQPGGLDWDQLADLLDPLVATERLIGMSVADLRADLDPSGAHAQRVVDLLATRIISA